MKLRKGDVLPIEISPEITAHVDGVPVMECTYGTSHNRYALRVKKVLTHNEPEFIQATTAKTP